MDNVTKYLENSFLKDLIRKPNINDISYNGVDIFYEDKLIGRQKSSLTVSSQEVSDFLRQIANLTEKQFSYANPILDVSFSKYRVNAMFNNVVKIGEEKSYSFSIRIASNSFDLDLGFFGGNSENIILNAIDNKQSIVIAGSTSSGKTQLQKYIISRLNKNTRVIVIDNVKELELVRGHNDIDLTTWQSDENNKSITTPLLIRSALRNNPDYLIVAESRGAEMVNLLTSVMSGHPIITTLHAQDIEGVPQRMCRMVMMANERENPELILDDIYHHFSLIVFLKKETQENGKIKRYVESIGTFDEKLKKVKILYKRGKA